VSLNVSPNKDISATAAGDGRDGRIVRGVGDDVYVSAVVVVVVIATAAIVASIGF